MEREDCSVCEWRPATRRGRCIGCYQYWRRNGTDRPDHLIVAEGRREAQLIEEAEALGLDPETLRRLQKPGVMRKLGSVLGD